MTKRVLNTPFSDLIREIGMKLKSSADARLNELGLNSQQGRMIGFIHENQEKGVIQKNLADEFKRKGASITSMLQGLEKKGYIERVTPANDERQKSISVTEKSIILVEEFNDIFLEVEKSITGTLTQEETETLKSLLLKVNSGL